MLIPGTRKSAYRVASKPHRQISRNGTVHMDWFAAALPPGLGVIGIVVALLVAHWFLNRHPDAVSYRFRNQMLMIGFTAVAALAILLILPFSSDTRGQLLSFFGILITASIALSSTTFLGNALAGLMLRAVRNFRIGDFVRAGDHFGRVSERGLLHIEIQTEDRELTTLPNLFLVRNPVTTLLSSGTVISATVTLGYDLPRTKVRETLLEAAEKAGLTDAFVQILELGDFSVEYRVAGILKEVKQILTARSDLRARILDSMHANRMEIVSPTFMNTRALSKGDVVIPPSPVVSPPPEPEDSPEGVVFDKAEWAEGALLLETEYKRLCERLAEVQGQAKGAPPAVKVEIEAEIAELRKTKERLEEAIAEEKAALEDK
jgi:small conductance mechanosensitive channel